MPVRGGAKVQEMLRKAERGQDMNPFGLTPQQLLFVHHYMACGNATQAVKDAGYEVANDPSASALGYKLRRITNVAMAINHERRLRVKRLRIDADWVVTGFVLEYLKAEAAGDRQNALKALELVGKHLGVFEKDNRQKRDPSESEVEAIKAQLRQRGYDLDALGSGRHN